MLLLKRVVPAIVLFSLPLGAICCGGPGDSDAGLEQGQAAEEQPLVGGEEAAVLLQNDSTVYGYSLVIRKPDGTREFALFRGPLKLLEVMTGGTFELDADSITSRVRLLQPGEEIRREKWPER